MKIRIIALLCVLMLFAQLTPTLAAEPVCQIIASDGYPEETYTSVEEALAQYDASSGGYIRLLKNIYDTVTIDKPVYLDTNGFNITVALEGEGTFYGMENASDDYQTFGDDLGQVTVDTGSVRYATDIVIDGVRYQYLPMEIRSGVYTYHRYELDTRVGLRAYTKDYAAALYFQPTFKADDQLTMQLTTTAATYGVIVTPQKEGAQPVETSFEEAGIAFDEKLMHGGYRVVVPELMPSDASLSAGTATLQKNNLSNIVLAGQAYFRLIGSDGEAYYICDDTNAKASLKNAVLTADKNEVFNTLTQKQKTSLNTMNKRYSKAIATWGKDIFANIGDVKVDISDWYG